MMPRARSAVAKGPSPSRTKVVSSFDSATCTAIGRCASRGDSARPAIADAGHGSRVERLRAGRVFQLANAADPCEKLGLVVLRPAAQMRELEMRVAIDEARHELRVGKLPRLDARR